MHPDTDYIDLSSTTLLLKASNSRIIKGLIKQCFSFLGGLLFSWRRKWQPTPLLLPGKSHGRKSLVGYSPWVHIARHDWVMSLFHYLVCPIYFVPEKAMAPHSSTLAWKNPWSLVGCSPWGCWVRHDWASSLSLFTFMHWRRKWQPTPGFLPAESQGRGSLVGCRLWGRTEWDTTEAT